MINLSAELMTLFLHFPRLCLLDLNKASPELTKQFLDLTDLAGLFSKDLDEEWELDMEEFEQELEGERES